MRPRIGITSSSRVLSPEGDDALSVAVYQIYSRAVFEAGGLPMVLPSLDAGCAGDVIASIDGLLFSGGGDIDPENWGEAPHPNLGAVDTVRDAFEIALFQGALEMDLPVLGICRGVQVMAAAAGGSLWQDIPTQVDGAATHRQTKDNAPLTHIIDITPGSLLSRTLWSDEEAMEADHKLSVNSFHHQAPKTYGTILQSVARCAEDGIIEGLEVSDAAFALGVQWHPERMIDEYPIQRRLFAGLVQAAQARASIRRN